MIAEPVSIAELKGWRHLALGTVQSTNMLCMDHARAGDSGNLWITATEQTGGRGRRGRAWVSKPGNLYASLLLIDPATHKDAGTLSFVAALALHGAILAVAPALSTRLAVKWPNDLLLDGKKLSGILLESSPLRDGRFAVVIGCGVNCGHFPEEALYPTTGLRASGFDIKPEGLFTELKKSMAYELDIWNRGTGFASTRKRWLEHAIGFGGPIIARLPDKEIIGTFEALDEAGRLVLLMKNGSREKIPAADIFFGIAETNRA